MKMFHLFYIGIILTSLGLGLGLNSCALSSGSLTNSVSNFTVIATWTGSGGEAILSVYAESTNIYAAAGADGLYIFSSTLGYLNKFYMNVYPIKDVVVTSCFSAKYAFVANGFLGGSGGVMMISLADLTNLFVTNLCVVPGKNPNAIVINSDLTNIYTADHLTGYQNYTNSWNSGNTMTNKLASLGFPGLDIAVSGARAYVAAGVGGVFVLDQTVNNGQLAEVTTFLTYANAVAVSGSGNGTLLAVGDNLGLVLFNMDSPDQPERPRYLGGYYGMPVYDVAIDGNDFYLALGTAGVIKLTRTPPANFTLMKQYTDASCYKLFYFPTTGYVYAACGRDGIRLLR